MTGRSAGSIVPVTSGTGTASRSRDSRGTRIYPETPADPAKRFLCVGDSFTFGYEVADDECYPAQGEQICCRAPSGSTSASVAAVSPRRCCNTARPGAKFGGKYVVIGFMTNNQKRTVNCFRAFVAPGGIR